MLLGHTSLHPYPNHSSPRYVGLFLVYPVSLLLIVTRPVPAAFPAAEDQPRDPSESVAPIKTTSAKRDPRAPYADIKSIITDFLTRSAYQWGVTQQDPELRAAVAIEALRWDTCGNVSLVEKIVDCACDFIESAYGHLSPTHRRYVAIYTACILFCDDLGGQRLEAVRQFATRLTSGQPQLTPALDTLAGLLRKAHELWPAVGADAIISGTIDAVTGMYLEYTTQDMEINQRTTWWPTYLRTRTGINAPFIHFIFMKSFRATPESYLQLLP